MSAIYIKRIQKDIKEYQKNIDTYNKEGIYINFDEDNLTGPHQCLLIGQDDTPYKGGFFPFEFTYPSSYPLQPPKLKFISLDSKCRIHPNLYGCGKVCLSIIGTWSGPGWTPVMNIITVFNALNGIQLSNKHPIQCEPSYETETGQMSLNYNKVVQYETLRLYVLRMVNDTPETFKIFKPVIDSYYEKFLDYYKEYCNQNKDVKQLKYPFYSRTILITNFTKMLEKL